MGIQGEEASRTPPPAEAQVPISRKKLSFAHRKAPEGSGAQGSPHRVVEDPPRSPHKTCKERQGGGRPPGGGKVCGGDRRPPILPLFIDREGRARARSPGEVGNPIS